MGSQEPKPVVTLAALYGAGGSVVGPRVAERLGVPFLDRAIPEAVAARTGLSKSAVASVDEAPRRGMDRLLSSLGRASVPTPADARDHLDQQERRLRKSVAYLIGLIRAQPPTSPVTAQASGGCNLKVFGTSLGRQIPLIRPTPIAPYLYSPSVCSRLRSERSIFRPQRASRIRRAIRQSCGQTQDDRQGVTT
jgi:Cytidylate kinase-like family